MVSRGSPVARAVARENEEKAMTVILITGANRGLGLEFVRQYQDEGITIHACCRDPENAAELNALAAASGGSTTVHRMEVTDPSQVRAVAEALNGVAIDTTIDAPEEGAFGSVDYGAWEEVMRVNVLAPFSICEAFVEHVAASDEKLMFFLSTHMGSITELADGGFYPYRSSKSALNLIVKGLSIDLADRGIRTLAMHPGWVKTDMGSQAAAVEIPDSIAGMRSVIAGYKAPRTAEFINYDNTPIQW
jgi:NAD(P)-dependent dehydrogenase (short-subunit alcohol dehydrogenase family)